MRPITNSERRKHRVTTGTLDSLTLAERLLQVGADPDARITWKEPPFNKVSGRVRVPRDVSVAPTYLSWVGATPFFVAAKSADVPLMRLLVEHGADRRWCTNTVSPWGAGEISGRCDGRTSTISV